MIHTIQIGSCSVSVLEIASVDRSADDIAATFPDASPGAIRTAVGPGTVWSFNLLLLRFEDRSVLVDTGFGFREGGPGAATAELLDQAGSSAADVTDVVITHGHGDHIGGLLDEGAPAFPIADLLISRPELEYWTGPRSDSLGPDRVAPARAALGAYSARTRAFEPGGVIVEGDAVRVTSVAAPGHTPGHSGLRVAAGGEAIVAIVDTLHAEVQFAHPEWSPRFDTDAELAHATRERLLAELEASGVLVHAYHLAFPGLGRVEKAPAGVTGYRWVAEPATR